MLLLYNYIVTSKIGKNMVETPGRIEPCFFEDGIPGVLADLIVEIQQAATALGRGLHPDSAAELADLGRVMNSYYSNLIEGHNTRPKDIERALAGMEVDPKRRHLALEGKAHVIVQRKIDEAQRKGSLGIPTSIEFLKWLHRSFYERVPAELRVLERPDGQKVDVVPGEFRSGPGHDVAVGRHVPPSSASVQASMAHFAARFATADKSATNRIIAIASAHHRLNYIHPFVDGNGRVSRLMSHAMAQRAGIGGHGLWSICRGLARGLKDKSEYMSMMDDADSPRRGDLDGRGNLSFSALKDFCEWFLSVALDQIKFSTVMFDIERLEGRYRRLVGDVMDDKRAPDLVAGVLKHGEIARGDADMLLRTSERTARNTVAALNKAGFLKSTSPKAPLRIAFPLDYRERLFPNLFGDAEIAAPEPPILSWH
jgi:Fic family protein